MISQLFILAPRGDTVVKKEFRFDVPKNTPEVFFRAARFWRDGEKAPAVFRERGVNYLHVKVRAAGRKRNRTRARAKPSRERLSERDLRRNRTAERRRSSNDPDRLSLAIPPSNDPTRRPLGCSSSRRREGTPVRL